MDSETLQMHHAHVLTTLAGMMAKDRYTGMLTVRLAIFGSDVDIADHHATNLYYKWLWVNNPNWTNQRRMLGGEAEAALRRADQEAISAYLREAKTIVEKILQRKS
jgi:hypothetical protein